MSALRRVIARPAFENRERNPYNALLYEAVRDLGVDVVEWSSASAASAGPGDVVHVHWPEGHLNHRRWVRAAPRSAQLLRELRSARRRGARLVWTAHNLRAHDSRWRRTESLFWRSFLPLVDGWLSLSEDGVRAVTARWPTLTDRPHAVTEHGHYRSAHPSPVARNEARRRLGLPTEPFVIAFVGRIKPYKGVPELCEAFTDTDGADLRLLVAGRVETEELSRRLDRAAAADPRIVVRPGAVPDAELPTLFGAADLVVAPFQAILHSGSVLLALSLDRPVLVPSKGNMPALAERLGPGWVRTYDGDLDAAALASAVDWAGRPRSGRPDLSAHEWPLIAGQTVALYERVVAGHEAPPRL